MPVCQPASAFPSSDTYKQSLRHTRRCRAARSPSMAEQSLLPASSLQALSSILGDSRTGLERGEVGRVALAAGLAPPRANADTPTVLLVFALLSKAQDDAGASAPVLRFVREAIAAIRSRNPGGRRVLAEHACDIVLKANGIELAPPPGPG